MANFTPSFTKQFINNCQTLKITDTSNYGFSNNDEHLLKEDFPIKKVILNDIFNTTLATQDLDENGEAIFNLSLLSLPQLYLGITLQLGGTVTNFSLTSGNLLPCLI